MVTPQWGIYRSCGPAGSTARCPPVEAPIAHGEPTSSFLWRKIIPQLPGRVIYAKVYRIQVGRVPLYLLDTDVDGNPDWARTITDKLYGGRANDYLIAGPAAVSSDGCTTAAPTS